MSVLAQEEPLAAAVEDDKLEYTCSTCFAYKHEQSILRCSRCRVIHYCDRVCQKKDWEEHKYECMFLEKCAPRRPTSLARLICRLALKKAAGPPPVAFNGRTWERMMDHRVNIQKDAERAEMFILTNSFTITDNGSGNISLGVGVYVGLSAHDHSCQPDCFIIFDGKTSILRSPRSDLKYSTTLTISYTDLIATTSTRKETLKRQYYFDCTCSLCADKTRDFWGRSAYASCCTDGVCLFDPRSLNLSCFYCGSPSPLNPDDVEMANIELDLYLTKTKMGTDLPYELQKALQMYEKFRTVLSSVNFLMADLGQRIQDIAMELGRREIAMRFSTYAITAFKRYLPPGHPELTTRLMSAAIASSFAEPPTGQTLELFQEAYDAALLSHGPRHKLSSQIDHLLSQYRIRLQRDLAC